MAAPYWDYFVALEEDLIRTSRFVQFHKDNLKTYSIEFARLLLASSSEVDVIAKELCEVARPGSDPKNIDNYRTIITGKYQHCHTNEIRLPLYELSFQPWKEWASGTNPAWWKSYNNVKHERRRHFSEATLENTIYSIAGLFCLLLYFYKYSTPPTDALPPLYPAPTLFDHEVAGAPLSEYPAGATMYVYQLPDP